MLPERRHASTWPASRCLQGAAPHPAGSLAACKAVWQVALAVLPPAVRVQYVWSAGQPDANVAATCEQRFAACASGVRTLQLNRFLVGRCLELAPQQLHSLAIAAPAVWPGQGTCNWAGQLHRFPGLQRLAINCQLLNSRQAAALGRLQLRQLLLHLYGQDEEEIPLPALPQVELLRITTGPDESEGAIPLPAGGAWLGSGGLERLVLRQMQVSPPPRVLTRLVALELGLVSLRVSARI